MNGAMPHWDSTEFTCKQRSLVDVFKILNNLTPKIFKELFQPMDHGKNTRRNNSLLKLSKAKTEAGRKRFAFHASVMYNIFK